jgi:hypothetical protein
MSSIIILWRSLCHTKLTIEGLAQKIKRAKKKRNMLYSSSQMIQTTTNSCFPQKSSVVAPPHPSLRQKVITKWREAALPSEVLHTSPQLVQFLFDSTLLSQTKICQTPPVRMFGNTPQILVEGNWISEKEFLERFETSYSPRYKQLFVLDKRTHDVYTMLGNGRGLENYHPYLSDQPIAQITQDAYRAVHAKASQFVRQNDPTPGALRPYVLQVVTTRTERGKTNLAKTLLNVRHAYLRLISPDGSVHEFGFEWAGPPFPPFASITGNFRSPDLWEYRHTDNRVITNVSLSEKEVASMREFVSRYHKDSINLGRTTSFHFLLQNCTVFVREACAAAGVVVPTEMKVTTLIATIMPDWIQAIGRQLRAWRDALFTWIASKLPTRITACLNYLKNKIADLWARLVHLVVSLALLPFRLCLGDGFGRTGAAFHQKDGKSRSFAPPLHSPENMFNARVNPPSVLQEWQLKQPSTTVFHKANRLVIV